VLLLVLLDLLLQVLCFVQRGVQLLLQLLKVLQLLLLLCLSGEACLHCSQASARVWTGYPRCTCGCCCPARCCRADIRHILLLLLQRPLLPLLCRWLRRAPLLSLLPQAPVH
jgi:hypothetical protein